MSHNGNNKRPREAHGGGGGPRKAHKPRHDSGPTKFSLADLDAKHPSTSAYAPIPTCPQPTSSPGRIETTCTSYPPPLPPLPEDLQRAVFTSASVADHRKRELNYERLEFLGDAYVELIATRLIHSRFPLLPVGRQSLLRETLVRNSTLARFARHYRLADRLKTSTPTPTDRAREKELGDLVEAYVGAIALADGRAADDDRGADDARGGFAIAEEWLTALWVPVLLEEDPNLAVVVNRKDELARAVGGKEVRIEYRLEAASQAKGLQSHRVGVWLTGWGHENLRLGDGVGISKAEAGMRAAADCLDRRGAVFEEIVRTKTAFDEERRRRLAEEAGLAGGAGDDADEKDDGKGAGKSDGKVKPGSE